MVDRHRRSFLQQIAVGVASVGAIPVVHSAEQRWLPKESGSFDVDAAGNVSNVIVNPAPTESPSILDQAIDGIIDDAEAAKAFAENVGPAKCVGAYSYEFDRMMTGEEIEALQARRSRLRYNAKVRGNKSRYCDYRDGFTTQAGDHIVCYDDRLYSQRQVPGQPQPKLRLGDIYVVEHVSKWGSIALVGIPTYTRANGETYRRFYGPTRFRLLCRADGTVPLL